MIPRLLGLDPGRFRSHYGTNLIEVHPPDIWLMAAAQFPKKKYRVMEKWVADIHGNKRLTYVVVEKNNVGIHVIEDLEDQYHLPVMPITTVGNLVDRKKILSARSMNKVEHADWLHKFIQNGHLKYPKNDTPGHKMMRTQISKVVKKFTPTGKPTYGGEGKQPDDMWMSLMVSTYVARKIFLTNHSIRPVGSTRATALSQKNPKQLAIQSVVNRVLSNKNFGTITGLKVDNVD